MQHSQTAIQLPFDEATYTQAITVLQQAAASYGIKATTQVTDNYNRIWARDTAVAGLAIVGNQITALYPALLVSLQTLQKAANTNGQIPSNVSVTANGLITGISFGGPAGRTDAGFWWMIASVLYLQQQPNEAFATTVYKQGEAIFALADNWEFNDKGLMYLPMSGNWADEYITHGYVLYDQLLRCWALQLAGKHFGNDVWENKAQQIKLLVKQHFLLETELTNSLYTKAQQESLQHFDITTQFIASYSPGDRVEKYDGWSIGLLLMLQIPSPATIQKLTTAIKAVFNQYHQIGIPAFWPFIEPGDTLYHSLQYNHHYQFKNHPGHFHNGGVWPVVNGFIITGLAFVGEKNMALQLATALQQQLQTNRQTHPFAEYFDAKTGKPGGVNNLCYSASGYLLATQALQNVSQLQAILQLQPLNEQPTILAAAEKAAQNVLQYITIQSGKVTAISVAGESGSGKTTLGKALATVLQQKGYKVVLLHQDDYFALPPQQNHQARLQNFAHIGTSEVRLDLLDEHLRIIKERKVATLSIPVMNWVTDTEESDMIDVANADVVLVDGTYTSLLTEVGIKIFITTSYAQTKQNRINRNREPVTDFIERVVAKESSIIQPHAVLADIWVDNNLQVSLPQKG